jgi:hypothetical protein
MRDEWGIVKGLVFAFVLAPAVASAQLIQGIPQSRTGPTVMTGDRVPEDVYIMPWIAGGVVYDDNVLFQRQGRRVDDVFLRVTPGLQASYQSTPFTIVGNYRFDSEVYNKLDQLNSPQQRQFGTIEMRGRPTTNWTLGNTIGYAQTRTPFELNLLTSVQVNRLRTERYFVNPNTEYRVDPLTKLVGQYAFSKDIFAGAVEINSHIFNLGIERRLSAHDTVGPAYVGRHFTFGGDFNSPFVGFLGGNPGDVNSHAFVLTWGHDFSADTRLDARAGPRFTNGRLDDRPEAFVGLRRRIPGGEVGLSYTSALTTVIGTVGSTRTDTLVLTFAYEPVKRLTVTVSPAASWIKSSAFDASIYTGYVEAAYQFNKYLTGKASAYFSYQEGHTQTTAGATATDNVIIARDVYWLRLEFSYPARWE